MSTLTQIYRYPLKSAAAVSLPTATIGERGIDDDRRWMIVDENGRFITGRRYPKLVTVHVDLTDEGLRLNATGQSPLSVSTPDASASLTEVEIWGDRLSARRADATAAEWLSTYRRTDGGVMFGQNLLTITPGRVEVGDAVVVE